ncbi:hypothetical protein [Bosea sp. 117]|uniref:hypothetical protein n=1 Tax=Bosea sp. 117 TaxID=1125973 RepID=UPI00049437B6|nr:hypothetical protein [Bosea sp. 117]
MMEDEVAVLEMFYRDWRLNGEARDYSGRHVKAVADIRLLDWVDVGGALQSCLNRGWLSGSQERVRLTSEGIRVGMEHFAGA